MELTIITGLSGAGKSGAMGAFEDADFFCIDNLPPQLLPSLVDLFRLEGSSVERAALVFDVRGGAWFDELARELDRIAQIPGIHMQMVFLEASDDVLLARFRETRRRHPLAEGGEVLRGIEKERALLQEVRDRADVVIDTSAMNTWQLREAVAQEMAPAHRPRMRVTFSSFGFKHGVPREADLMFDVRFLRNPHYVPELTALTGEDAAVADYVADDPGYEGFMDRLFAFLDYVLPLYEAEGKRHLVVAIGCTGGRHRSVTVARALAARYAESLDVTLAHRDAGRPAEVRSA
ncbi:MAG: RNase adapter RapZ [Acidobacteria bacterium]|nr:RNase adapter RapZ [Acidobacteriota bacterium]